jgi:hypothetical protein
MNPKLQFLEIQAAGSRNDNLAVEHASLGKLGVQGGQQFRKITIQRLRVSTLDEDLVAIAKDQRSKTVPLGFEYPGVTRWKRSDPFGEHGQDRRIDGEIHPTSYTRIGDDC